uniref:Uncharacterized protein n=1 Tax=Chromera velia CCMP2878 TaxID=1169474 RepID=A0A0K6S7F0_9ALVE|eukprot:Cvel_20245.t2-p1 / transcript=Cvel_20245.t2 / gene=Cvel_20245 / organism=Chromera_velia_CCMP2878 / gene_product=hypothetical protein / transcript_product=hypothetical protein / location=Cvel_scaffold1804:16725-24615(+) / protein_length=344 / sequence_SO=supercontig / SO=protein_coding / is_pseudo=false
MQSVEVWHRQYVHQQQTSGADGAQADADAAAPAKEESNGDGMGSRGEFTGAAFAPRNHAGGKQNPQVSLLFVAPMLLFSHLDFSFASHLAALFYECGGSSFYFLQLFSLLGKKSPSYLTSPLPSSPVDDRVPNLQRRALCMLRPIFIGSQACRAVLQTGNVLVGVRADKTLKRWEPDRKVKRMTPYTDTVKLEEEETGSEHEDDDDDFVLWPEALLSSAPASPPSLGPSEDAPAPEPSSSCGVSLVSGLPRSPRPAGVSSAWYLGGSSFLAVAFWFGGNVGGAEGTLLFYSCMACVMHVRRPDSFIESTGRCVRCSGCHFAGKALEIRRREIGGKGTKGCVGIP